MSMHRRLLGLLAMMALVLAACTSGGATSPAQRRHRSRLHRRRHPSEAPPSEAAAEPVTVEWWHITTGDPGKTVFRKRRTPTLRLIRTSRSTSPSSRTRRSRPSSPPRCSRARCLTSSSRGAAASWPLRPTPACSRTSRRRHRALEGHDQSSAPCVASATWWWRKPPSFMVDCIAIMGSGGGVFSKHRNARTWPTGDVG